LKSLLSNNSVKSILKKNDIPIIKLEGSINNKSNLKLISEFKPDLLVSILGNQIFKKPLIDLAPKGCINLHTALLPKYRGLMPTFWVLKNNEEHTGVSVFFVDEGIDSGPIIVQRKIKIGNQTQRQLISNTKRLGMECILKAIELIEKDQVELIPNPDSEQTYYSFPTRKDVLEFKQAKKKFF
jgi:methionyl-tRNA formyltransferase